MEQDKIWDHFQTEDLAAFEGNSARLNYIARQASRKGMSVLNIGVGNGALEHRLLEKGAIIYCLDPSETAIQNLRKNLGIDASAAKVGYSQQIPFADAMFDIVFMSEVVEHLGDAVLLQTLKEVSRVLKAGGRLIGTVPADEVLKAAESVCPDCGKIFHRWGHVQSFTQERLETLLRAEFNAVVVKRIYFGAWSTLNWKGKIIWLMKKAMVFLGEKGSDENYYFVGYKK